MFSIEGIIVNSAQTRKRIEIDTMSGLIIKVSEPTGVADVILKDELIFPGFIDLHVHAREDVGHTQDYKEDFFTAGEAAINGGVVAFAEMPNNPVAPVDDTSYDLKNKLTQKSSVAVVLYAGIGPTTEPLARLVPYKAFMGPSVGDLFFTSREDLDKVLEKYQGQNVSFHCEDPETLEKHKEASTHGSKRPKEAEILAVDFAIELIKKYKLIGKICHCSTSKGINKIINAKKAGVNITVEVTPHHLYFDESMLSVDNQVQFQVNPPIRQTRENRLALLSALKKGEIDYLATDHAPHTVEEKEKGTSGLTHLDTYGSFSAWLIQEHNFSPEEISRVCSTNPANFINKFLSKDVGEFGQIKEGCVGSFTILDITKPTTITKDKLKTKCGWSQFLGVTFPGTVVMTIIRGKILKNEIK